MTGSTLVILGRGFIRPSLASGPFVAEPTPSTKVFCAAQPTRARLAPAVLGEIHLESRDWRCRRQLDVPRTRRGCGGGGSLGENSILILSTKATLGICRTILAQRSCLHRPHKSSTSRVGSSSAS